MYRCCIKENQYFKNPSMINVTMIYLRTSNINTVVRYMMKAMKEQHEKKLILCIYLINSIFFSNTTFKPELYIKL